MPPTCPASPKPRRSRRGALDRIPGRWSTEADLQATLRRVAGTLALEGFVLTDDDRELIARALRGEITEEEFVQAALKRAREGDTDS